MGKISPAFLLPLFTTTITSYDFVLWSLALPFQLSKGPLFPLLPVEYTSWQPRVFCFTGHIVIEAMYTRLVCSESSLVSIFIFSVQNVFSCSSLLVFSLVTIISCWRSPQILACSRTETFWNDTIINYWKITIQKYTKRQQKPMH